MTGGMAIQVRNLTRTVPDKDSLRNRRILDDVSVDFSPGEVTALIGPSGCGKSTLLKAICGIEQADKPTSETQGIFFNGHAYYDNMEDLSHRIAYLPQFDTEWLHDELTVNQELDYTWALRSTGRTAAESVERKRGGSVLGSLHKRHIDDKRFDRIENLSGGQKKRAAIVGALMAEPELLLLDEPTAPLDPGSSAEFIADLVLNARNKNLTTIIVTHDPIALQGLGDNCHIVLMERNGGRIGFDGTRRQLSAVLAKQYGVTDFEAGIQRLFIDFANKADLSFLNVSSESQLSSIREQVLDNIKPAGWLRQFGLLLRRELSLFRGRGASTLTLLIMPVVLGLILSAVVKQDEIYTSYNMTKAMMFALGACAFFVGVFDSIGVFQNKQRLRVEELHGLKPGAYVLAVSIVMTVLALLQSLILYLVFTTRIDSFPEIVLYDSQFDMFLTAFLCSYSASMLGMLCSAVFQNSTYVAPVLVIIQIVFSGILFDLEGITKKFSLFVSCHWSMNALAALCDLNNLPVESLPEELTALGPVFYTNDEFVSEKYTLFTSWLMLLMLGIGALLLCMVVMGVSRRILFHPDCFGARSMGSFVAKTRQLVSKAVVPLFILAAVFALFSAFSGGLDASIVVQSISEFFRYLKEVFRDLPGFLSRLFNSGALLS